MNLRYLKIIVLFSLLMTGGNALGAPEPPGTEIPWEEMAADTAAVTRKALEAYTFYREKEEVWPACFPLALEYMLDNLRITNLVMRQVSPQLERCTANSEKGSCLFADKQLHTSGTLKLLHKNPHLRLYRVEGHWHYWGDYYIQSTAIVSLSYQPVLPGSTGPLQTKMRFYIKVDNPVISALGKTFDLFVPRLVDQRVALISYTLRAAGEKMCREPQYVSELLSKEPGISEAERREYTATFLSH